ncbi:MAG: hypothetical protein M5U34_48180 [Chloroflexi bacterium]|nr:hypothetical protein [Chloroflexota bacterium]
MRYENGRFLSETAVFPCTSFPLIPNQLKKERHLPNGEERARCPRSYLRGNSCIVYTGCPPGLPRWFHSCFCCWCGSLSSPGAITTASSCRGRGRWVSNFYWWRATCCLLRHSLITIMEVIPGLLLGFSVALPLGYLLAKSRLAERLLSPYLVASQAIPIIAIAPLLTIWISSTYWSRVLVAALVVFFRC